MLNISEVSDLLETEKGEDSPLLTRLKVLDLSFKDTSCSCVQPSFAIWDIFSLSFRSLANLAHTFLCPRFQSATWHSRPQSETNCIRKKEKVRVRAG